MSELLKQRGNDEFKKGNFYKADQLYIEALTISPGNVILYSNRAMTLLKLEKWKDCLLVCEQGLRLDTEDNKTTMKFLWRSGIAYMNLNQFSEARESFKRALSMEVSNKSIQDSLSDLEKREQLFKRSRSEESLLQEKRLKTDDTRLRVPIYEVDKLPDLSSSVEVQDTRYSHGSESRSKGPTISTISSSLATSDSALAKSYPDAPSIYQLSSIIKNFDDFTFNYCFDLPIPLLKKMFAGGSIDISFVNFFLDSICFRLDMDHSDDTLEKSLQLLETLSSSPRFSLAKMLVIPEKVNGIRSKLQNLTRNGNTTIKNRISSVMKLWIN
ncbi:hypothetical protein WICPIJ_003353 [Wickerhamomyces pijperi]|uniref:RNA-polymerase II-associated protein 3-like C-terminal domain-containing protein n=1 Tax=Wickerhamomyces pijperi TaxID=599730 RepID=A0A9P8TNY4_WICPI|nr:hypothetical protein WICPIJ_003353 [Wickerhamomyces pijperi]